MRVVRSMLVLPLMATLVGCWAVEVGSGHEVEEEREVGRFERIEVHNGLQLRATLGLEREVWVRGDDNLVDLVRTRVRGDTLVIDVREGLGVAPVAGLVIEVMNPMLRELDASGGSDVRINRIDEPDLKVEASGGSHVALIGDVTDLEARASGGSVLALEDLVADFAHVHTSGGSIARVHVLEEISVEASGGSHVKVSGDPRVTKRDLSGGSRLTLE